MILLFLTGVLFPRRSISLPAGLSRTGVLLPRHFPGISPWSSLTITYSFPSPCTDLLPLPPRPPQDSSFCYDPKEASKSVKEIESDFLFREGKTLSGEVTYTPRAILFDLKDSLRTLKPTGSLYGEFQSETPVRLRVHLCMRVCWFLLNARVDF